MKLAIRKPHFRFLFLVSIALFLTQCASNIALFDQQAYSQATSLKVDALRLMDKATETYESKKQQIEDIQVKLQKAYEYESHRPKNNITASMWSILIDPQKHLLGEFLQKRQAESTMRKAFIDESKVQEGEGGYLLMSEGSSIDVARNKKELLLKRLLPNKA